MESERFDGLVRHLAAGGSRRELLSRTVALVFGAVAGLRGRPAAALDCPSGEYVCGQGSQATPTCCPFFNACCHSTGQCCAPNQICFQGPNNADVCQDSCRLNETRCGGDGECCPFFDGTCCGVGNKLCCGPGDHCFDPGGGAPSRCQRTCGANEVRCANGAGDCCPVFGGVCCGDGGRTCCNPNDICDQQTGGAPSCATPCDLFSRRCATTGVCCPYGQPCCGEACCFPGERCIQNTHCEPQRRRRRRRRHHR